MNDLPSLAHCKIANRPYIKSVQSEHQKHFCGPAPDTPQLGQFSNHVVVVLVDNEGIQIQFTMNTCRGKSMNRSSFGTREPHTAQFLSVAFENCCGCYRSTQVCMQAGGDGVRGTHRDLLADHRHDESMERVKSGFAADRA